MKQFLQTIKEKAKRSPKRIVFPEGFDERILEATATILKEGTAFPILLGIQQELQTKAENLKISIDWDHVEVIDPRTNDRLPKFAADYVKIRKGTLSEKEAIEIMQNDINVFGTMLVENGEADGMISGSTFPTADTIRPALQIIKTKEPFRKVSGFFVMILEKRILLFADCAVIPKPSAHELADIAIDSAETAKRFGIEPRIAMLSFSTAGSAKHHSVDKVREATQMVKTHRPDLLIEGEMQVDAALVPQICHRKFPTSTSCGDFNVLIFPNLDAGNISYKLVQRLANAEAIGPILQGLKKPINDLSRGCDAEDIVNLTAFTTVEAQGIEKLID